MAYKVIGIKDSEGNVQTFKGKNCVKNAIEAILEGFAESGSNPVDEIWAIDAKGKEISLSVHWTAELEEA
jgi:hypothetical protein